MLTRPLASFKLPSTMSYKTREIHGLPFQYELEDLRKLPHTINLPAGLICSPIDQGPNAGKFYLVERPVSVFPEGSKLREHAIYTPIILERHQIDQGITTVALTFGTEHQADQFIRHLEAFRKHRCGLRYIASTFRALIRLTIACHKLQR